MKIEKIKENIRNILLEGVNDFRQDLLENICILCAWTMQIFAIFYAAFLFIRFYKLYGFPWNTNDIKILLFYSDSVDRQYSNDFLFMTYLCIYVILLAVIEILYCKKAEGIRKVLTVTDVVILVILGVSLIPYNIIARIPYFWTPEHFTQSRTILDQCILIYMCVLMFSMFLPSFVLREDDDYHFIIRRWRRSIFTSLVLIPGILELLGQEWGVFEFVFMCSIIIFTINKFMYPCHECKRWFAMRAVQEKLVATRDVPYIKRVRHYSPNGTYQGETEEDSTYLEKEYCITYICQYCGNEIQKKRREKIK